MQESTSREPIISSNYRYRLHFVMLHNKILRAEDFGFERRDNVLFPEIVILKPEGLPDPCTCGKCPHRNVCHCRVAGLMCCKYCKCKTNDFCQNPIANNINE